MIKIVVAGIGTGVGKTLVSAIVTEALQADYWKPVQSGRPTDKDMVRSLVANSNSVFHPEAYCFHTPVSPHAAARIDDVEIDLHKVSFPATNNHLVVELAGGLMVPLNEKELNLDLLKRWKAPVILVSQNYLGSINHTLLSVAALQGQGLQLAGIIFNGEENPSSENFILHYSKVDCLGRIKNEKEIDKATVSHYAAIFKNKLNELIP